MVRMCSVTLLAFTSLFSQVNQETVSTAGNSDFKRGVLVSLGGGVTIRNASGSDVDNTAKFYDNPPKSAALGGGGSFHLGYRLGKVNALYTGVDITSKGYRLKLASSGSQSAYLQQSGAALEFPILWRPIIPSHSGINRFVFTAGFAPSILLNDNLKIYADQTGLNATSNRETLSETVNLKTKDVTLYTADSSLSRTFSYDDFNRSFDINVQCTMGLEKMPSKHFGLYAVGVFRKGLLNAKRVSDEGASKLADLGGTITGSVKKFHSAEFQLGFNIYP